MLEAIRYNLTNLANISGRDSRSTFWFYVLFLMIVYAVISFGLSFVAGGALVMDAVHSARGGADDAAIQQHVISRMGNMIRISMWGSAIMYFLMTMLLAASFTRRLHDSNRPGWIAGAAVALQLLSIALTIGMIGEMASFVETLKPGDAAAMQAAIQAHRTKYALSGLLSWLPLLLVVVFGIWPSSDGDNLYGQEPEHL
ncbi:DUF805 domain-containing protein [Novosphingobium malaysiense]|uniref:DUF805 domain-containing protein n=1 Tax=Novosphingobium malaysiense TaxID=1348853 RepID=A0A0B1ZLQ9_9SPHN|nr:DUF805 domain-containing protein [Novosphingobium malaysiense]KHK91486.1 hypothetical protein LK12_11700 [Novosphingobium malaysiense]